MTGKILILLEICVFILSSSQDIRKVGRLTEVFAWKQLTYNIDGVSLTQDRVSDFQQNTLLRKRRQSDLVYFKNKYMDERVWNEKYTLLDSRVIPRWNLYRPKSSQPSPQTNLSQSHAFFIQYNNVPMGVERVGNRVFITVPRRRYGIPSTLNYVDLNQGSKSPDLKPYPDIRQARMLTSVYRTRADQCGRLWMVDTGLLEIPENPQQIQPPAIVIFDLNSDTQILRYQFKDDDIPAANTPTGQNFQWSDGIFSITIKKTGNACNTAYFHPLISYHEFAVSTCVLNNKTAIQGSDYWSLYSIVGERGEDSQSTMHSHHADTNIMFYAEIGRSALTCWNTAQLLKPANIAVLAKDSMRLSYPCDLHISNDEVWVLANTLPRFSYSRLDTSEYNFFVYRATIDELVSGTICSDR